MAGSSPDYKQLFLQSERARIRAEEKARSTTLPEFLDGCHTHLHCSLSVQSAAMSTKGDPVNADNKLRPDRIRPWEDFSARQAAIWEKIVASDFMQERHFAPVSALEYMGSNNKKISSEIDLHIFERQAVLDPVSRIVGRLHDKKKLRKAFKLEGSVEFENHANTLSPEQEDAGAGRRRSPRLLEQERQQAAPDSQTSAPRPRADQFCVYNISDGSAGGGDNGDGGGGRKRIPAFIFEYKPPHKITLGHIYEGLEGLDEMDLDEVVCCTDDEGAKDKLRRVMAAIITQAFSYMVQAGLEFGCVCNGEASIFLRVPDDPGTVFYYVSVPKGDVGDSTGWQPEPDGGDEANRLHLTAVGQMLAFSLQSLRTRPRNAAWRAGAGAQLKTWAVVYQDLLEEIPDTVVPSSEYRPPRNLLPVSPIRLRLRRRGPPSPDSRTNPRRGDDSSSSSSSDDDGLGPETPSRQPRPLSFRSAEGQALDGAAGSSTQGGSSSSDNNNRTRGGSTAGRRRGRYYCTRKCLRGLLNGGALDRSCPNACEHGSDRHQITAAAFCRLMRRQLAEDLDTNFQPVGRPGSRGVPFAARLASHGYTVAAKCSPPELAHHLAHEAAVYKRLRPIQGVHVPVRLGNIDLVQPYPYEGIAKLTHVMFLSFGGTPIHQHLSTANRAQLASQAADCLRAIHALGVLHRDAACRNILWDKESGCATVIDFERAELRARRPTLGVISPNRKRGQDEGGLAKEQAAAANQSCVYAKEMRAVSNNLAQLRPR